MCFLEICRLLKTLDVAFYTVPYCLIIILLFLLVLILDSLNFQLDFMILKLIISDLLHVLYV